MAYTAPTVSDFRAAFPAFTDPPVTDDTVQFWLTRAGRDVDESWTEGDYTFAIMVRAADLMTQQGIGADEVGAAINAGLSTFRSGSLSGSFSDAAQRNVAAGVNEDGQQWADLVRKNRGGPRVTAPGGDCNSQKATDQPWPFYGRWQ